MARWAVKNVVAEATMDMWGRRTNTRTFVIWDFPIDEGTARRIANTISSLSDTHVIVDSVTNLPLPGIGDAWSSETELGTYAQMYLDRYDVQIQGQEIIATAHYTTDVALSNLETNWVTQMVNIPYAIKVATGIAFAGAGGGSCQTWQLQGLQIPTCMTRLQVTGQVNLSSMGNLDAVISAAVNRLFWLSLLKAGPNVTDTGPIRLWKFEGAMCSELGPDYMAVRYSFIADPGNVSVAWPAAFAVDSPTSRFRVPPRTLSPYGGSQNDCVRAPFYEVKVLPPVYGADERPTPNDPKPPTFIQLPTALDVANGSSPLAASISLAGVGTFPFTARRYR